MVAQKSATHFDQIDFLRGAASLFVAFFHFTSYFLPSSNAFAQFFHFGYLGVDTFFFISGFVLPMSLARANFVLSADSFKQTLLKRIIRIEPAYWASIALMCFKDVLTACILSWNSFHLPPMYTVENFFYHIFHISAIMDQDWIRGIYWTLAVDWQFYIFGILAFALINRSEWWLRYPFYAACVVLQWFFWVKWLPFHILPFLGGIIYFHYWKGYIKKIELGVLWAALLYVVQWKMGWNHFAVLALSAIILVIPRKNWAWESYLGKISYSFYLTHVLSGWFMLTITEYLTRDAPNENFMTMACIVAVVVSIGFSKFFYDLVEEPTLAWSKRILKKRVK
jgi:peptidoglycan/LPS O-acetylase OafA/YrhL